MSGDVLTPEERAFVEGYRKAPAAIYGTACLRFIEIIDRLSVSPWRPVTGDDPPDGETVLTYHGEDTDTLTGWRCCRGRWWAAQPGTAKGLPMNRPSHWMPLPSVPEGKP